MSMFRTSMREICNQNKSHLKEFSPICMRICVFTISFMTDCNPHYKRVSRLTTTGVIQDRDEQAGGDEGRTEERKVVFWDIDHGHPRIHEEPR